MNVEKFKLDRATARHLMIFRYPKLIKAIRWSYQKYNLTEQDAADVIIDYLLTRKLRLTFVSENTRHLGDARTIINNAIGGRNAGQVVGDRVMRMYEWN